MYKIYQLRLQIREQLISGYDVQTLSFPVCFMLLAIVISQLTSS